MNNENITNSIDDRTLEKRREIYDKQEQARKIENEMSSLKDKQASDKLDEQRRKILLEEAEMEGKLAVTAGLRWYEVAAKTASRAKAFDKMQDYYNLYAKELENEITEEINKNGYKSYMEENLSWVSECYKSAGKVEEAERVREFLSKQKESLLK